MTKTDSVVARESQHTPIRDLGNGAIEYQLAHNARRVMNIGDAEFAEFIVRACNAHTKLVEALSNFREWYADHFEDFDSDVNAQLLCLDNEAEQALRLASGKEGA